MTSRKADWSKRTAKKTVGTTVVLDDRITVPVTPDRAWARLEDVPLVASCLPGLDTSSLVAESEHVYRARMTNTVMGISANWDLRATIEPNATTRTLRVVLDGEDRKLNMKLDGTATVDVKAADGNESLLDYVANLRIDGSLAAMGGPVIKAILADAIAQFISVVGGQEPAQKASAAARLRQRIADWWRRISGRREGTI
jgi:carbon monoxide dehydrogenase subunit G